MFEVVCMTEMDSAFDMHTHIDQVHVVMTGDGMPCLGVMRGWCAGRDVL